ncbi:MAG TPA: DUF1320 domain-containing protein [Fibrobacteria bacterium]|nr:DUF1320 domain-containing protein [Fibrobacteria bacterium]
MAYCTLADLLGRIPLIRMIELTDQTSPNPTGAIQSDVVDLAIKDSDAEIDSYLGQRYTLPMADVPKVVNKVSIDLAVYALYLGRVDHMPDGIESRRKHALAILQMIVDKKMSLGIPESQAPAQAPLVAVSVFSEGPLFTMDSMSSLGGGS